jgi:heme oxygenase
MLKNVNKTHEKLRAHTQKAHADLDQLACFRVLLSRELTVNDYASCIKALGEWFYQYETHIQKTFSQLKQLNHVVPKTNLIDKDLNKLDASPCRKTSLQPLAPDLHNFHFCLGIVYVIEGSTLGGKVIAPSIKKNLGLKNVTQYYDCYGQQKLMNFSNTLAFIDSFVSHDTQLDSTFRGAQFAFADLKQWMQCRAQQSVIVA